MTDLAYKLDIEHNISVEEYLSGEKTSQTKYEYVDGQDYAEVDVQRRDNNWQSSYYFLGDSVTFASVDVTLSIEAIYQRVDNQDMQDFLRPKEKIKRETRPLKYNDPLDQE